MKGRSTSLKIKLITRFKNIYHQNYVYGKVGYNSTIGKNTLLDHSSEVGHETFINTNCTITKSTIGNYCAIGSNVVIGPGEHSLNRLSNSGKFYSDPYNELTKKPCKIGHDVWIGTYAIIMRGVEIGNGAIIGANAVVTKDVPPFSIVAGVPAKLLRYKFDEETIEKITESEWWNLNLEEARIEIERIENLCQRR